MSSQTTTQRLFADRCFMCCKKEQRPTIVLKRCSRCMRVLFCSRECQLAKLAKHKEFCKFDLVAAHNIDMQNARMLTNVSLEMPFIGPKHYPLAHHSLLVDTAINALRLQTEPDRCLTHVLEITLAVVAGGIRPLSQIKTHAFFALRQATVLPLDEFLGRAPEAHAERFRESLQWDQAHVWSRGGVGVALVCISGIVEGDGPWLRFPIYVADTPVDEDWERSLRMKLPSPASEMDNEELFVQAAFGGL
ncbi:hypothetical protein BV22DRAFT_1195675 [Leucogyrophana mollusca]|uniref:Uncharacterized protein n=1 Tax=Leucogyrophana mollusca TaxID=85980 RepID=A0ACB8BG04_9AGAM|nr:hypothetical protein BV22DRAFT_1195675 [Leucogyrophana mollusca]